ncbi:MAG: DUF5320 domain-containing protein [archaeon]|nr:DUF5320 domain-containing protein [archaeon]
MAYGYGYGRGGGYRWGNMYYLTGLPGWGRFGYSPSWAGRSATGLLPTAQYLMQTGQMPQFIPGMQAMVLTHSNCVNFVPPNRCALKDKEVDSDSMGVACKDFQPRTFAPGYGAPFPTMPFGFTTPTMTKEQEIQMLENQAKMLEQEIEQVKKRIMELR